MKYFGYTRDGFRVRDRTDESHIQSIYHTFLVCSVLRYISCTDDSGVIFDEITYTHEFDVDIGFCNVVKKLPGDICIQEVYHGREIIVVTNREPFLSNMFTIALGKTGKYTYYVKTAYIGEVSRQDGFWGSYILLAKHLRNYDMPS